MGHLPFVFFEVADHPPSLTFPQAPAIWRGGRDLVITRPFG